MQYILTQAEYDALTPVKRLQDRNEALETARKLILKSSGFPCHHDLTEDQWKEYGGYPPLCDDCPIGSMLRDNYEQMNHICSLSKEYSK